MADRDGKFNNLTLTGICQAVQIKVDPTVAGGVLPYINISNLSSGSQPQASVFVQHDSSEREEGSSIFVQRNTTTDGGFVNPKALRAVYNVNQGGDPNSRPWAISGELNSNTTDSFLEAGVAVSGVSAKTAANNGILFAGHFQARDETGGTTQGGLIGVELNLQANGPDTNGNRIGFDVVAKTYSGGSGNGEYTAGIRVRNDATGGSWTTGILIDDDVGLEAIDTAVKASNSKVGGYGFFDEGSKFSAFWAAGTYAGPAFRMNSGHRFQLGANGADAITMRYNAAGDNIEFLKGATVKQTFSMA